MSEPGPCSNRRERGRGIPDRSQGGRRALGGLHRLPETRLQARRSGAGPASRDARSTRERRNRWRMRRARMSGESRESCAPCQRRGSSPAPGAATACRSFPTCSTCTCSIPTSSPTIWRPPKLYQQFFIKEGFYKYYGTSGKGTPVLRSIPVEQAIHPEEKTYTAEEAHAYIKGLETEDLALVPCPCRTRTEKLEIRECKDHFPVGTCIFIGKAALRFEELGLGKRVTKEQAIAYLDEMVELGLIATAENFLSEPHSIMCLCCGCCCSNVRGRTRWDNPTAVLPSAFVPQASDECIMCETCVDRCFFGALSMDDDAERVRGRSREVHRMRCVYHHLPDRSLEAPPLRTPQQAL